MSDWPNFSFSEFACRCDNCGGENKMDPKAIDEFQKIRNEVGFPLTVTSGYRCSHHPIEKDKATPGTHSRGIAADFAVSHEQARILLNQALRRNLGGVGVHQKGGGRFVHIDCDPSRVDLFWTY